MEANEVSRQMHLEKERKIQVQNSGVLVIFYRDDENCSFLHMAPENVETVKQWLSDRYSLNVYSNNGWKQLLLIDKSNAFLVEDRLYLQNKQASVRLTDRQYYILAKNNATIQMLKSALDGSHQAQMKIDLFINHPQVSEISSNKLFELEQWAYHGLNQSQRKAIQLVTNERIAFIKGPPGCGKTKTIARLATIFSFHGYPMLIGAVSNTANMAITNAIIKQCFEMNYMPNVVLFICKELYSENILHPPQIRCLTFRYKVVENFLLLNEFQNAQREEVEMMLDNFWAGYKSSNLFISVYYQAVAKVFLEASIVIVTTTSATKLDNKLDESQRFRPFIGVLDEASQASWADSYCFLNKGVQKMVFIGDEKQLAPTVISQNQVLKETVFAKTFQKNPKYYVLLNEQYRMHPAISEFPNEQFYNNELKDGVTEAERHSDIPYFQDYPVSFVNCESQEREEVERSGKRNLFNMGQIEIIKKVLAFFKAEQLCNVGIISPYDLQIKNIRACIGDEPFNLGLTARTCDGYQGSEREYIIVSCVRSNKEGKIGFCSEQTRLNVTLTRARRGLILIGNKETFLNSTEESNAWNKYLRYLEKKNLILDEKELEDYSKEPMKEEKEKQTI